jgi:hypothetical protein
MAHSGQLPAQLPHPVHSRAESSIGAPKGSSWTRSFRVQARTAAHCPEAPSQLAGSQRVKSISAFLFRLIIYPKSAYSVTKPCRNEPAS